MENMSHIVIGNAHVTPISLDMGSNLTPISRLCLFISKGAD